MDINEAAAIVEKFFAQYSQQNADWHPVEVRVLPSGDEMDAIKIWLNFAEGVADDEVERLRDVALAALRTAHPEVEDSFELVVRADAA
jgi:hypothetical protein